MLSSELQPKFSQSDQTNSSHGLKHFKNGNTNQITIRLRQDLANNHSRNQHSVNHNLNSGL